MSRFKDTQANREAALSKMNYCIQGDGIILWALPVKFRLTVSLLSLRASLHCIFGPKPELRGFGLANLLTDCC